MNLDEGFLWLREFPAAGDIDGSAPPCRSGLQTPGHPLRPEGRPLRAGRVCPRRALSRSWDPRLPPSLGSGPLQPWSPRALPPESPPSTSVLPSSHPPRTEGPPDPAAGPLLTLVPPSQQLARGTGRCQRRGTRLGACHSEEATSPILGELRCLEETAKTNFKTMWQEQREPTGRAALALQREHRRFPLSSAVRSELRLGRRVAGCPRGRALPVESGLGSHRARRRWA